MAAASTHPASTRPALSVEAVGLTDVGRRRDHNEDQVLVDDTLGLFAVADGMGGHQAGEVASAIVVSTLEQYLREGQGGGDVLADVDATAGARRLWAAVHECNRRVFAESGRSTNEGGMGSTVVAAHVSRDEGLIHVVHVGDSRCYRIRGGQLEQLTRDHSMINEALRLNPELSQEILAQLPTNVITRAIGNKEDVEPDWRSEPLVPGDIYLLCSDGLTGEVDDEDILGVVLAKERLEDACERLIEVANACGGRDNISVVLLRVVEGGEAYEPDEQVPATEVGVGEQAPADAPTGGKSELCADGEPRSPYLLYCAECNKRLRPKQRFCGICGAPNQPDENVARCDACGHEVLLGTSYCVECGACHGF